MIIDCHSHFMQPEYLDKRLHPQWEAVGYEPFPKMTFEQYDEAMKPVDRAIVFGVTANALGVRTPNETIAELVALRPEKYIGFMALDPTDSAAISEMDRCVSELGLRGIKLYPTMQHFDVRDIRFFPFFRRAQEHKLPILLHLGTSPFPGSILRYSQPLLLDEVAPAFPEVKFIIAHLGHPWQRDTAVVLRKHPNVFADISGLWHRPWEGYNAMITCVEWGVTDKLLFGSDYPLWTPAEAMAKLRTLNDQVSGTRLPQIPEDVIEGIIQRNALPMLGLQ